MNERWIIQIIKPTTAGPPCVWRQVPPTPQPRGSRPVDPASGASAQQQPSPGTGSTFVPSLQGQQPPYFPDYKPLLSSHSLNRAAFLWIFLQPSGGALAGTSSQKSFTKSGRMRRESSSAACQWILTPEECERIHHQARLLGRRGRSLRGRNGTRPRLSEAVQHGH